MHLLYNVWKVFEIIKTPVISQLDCHLQVLEKKVQKALKWVLKKIRETFKYLSSLTQKLSFRQGSSTSQPELNLLFSLE